MNTRSARAYAMFVDTQLLRDWHEQRPSKRSDLGLLVCVLAGTLSITQAVEMMSLNNVTKHLNI
jgi:hypothetical protein